VSLGSGAFGSRYWFRWHVRIMRQPPRMHLGNFSLFFGQKGNDQIPGVADSDQGAAHGDGRGFAPVGRPQLAQDVADMVARGLRADEERLRDLRVGVALC
jgi:hypothetical protein